MSYSTLFLGQTVTATVDHPVGSKHSKHGFFNPVNYGYIEGVEALDGEDLDAYILGVLDLVEELRGRCIAMIHQTDDDDDKLVVVPKGVTYRDEQIAALTEFQERFFNSSIIRDSA